jgi:hypothetical protein
MKKTIFIVILSAIAGFSLGQENSETTKFSTQYKDFQDAKIVMSNGDTIKAKANIFLKNDHLYFLRGSAILEADMSNVNEAVFNDGSVYCKIDTLMAKTVNSYKGNKILCCRLIDIQSYITKLKNSQLITGIDSHLSESGLLNIQSIDASTSDEEFPIHKIYYFYYNGKYVKVNDRDLYKSIPKDKRSVFNNVTKMDEFNWYDENWLFKLLKYIS